MMSKGLIIPEFDDEVVPTNETDGQPLVDTTPKYFGKLSSSGPNSCYATLFRALSGRPVKTGNCRCRVSLDKEAGKMAKSQERRFDSDEPPRIGMTTKEARVDKEVLRMTKMAARRDAFELSVELRIFKGDFGNKEDQDRYFVRDPSRRVIKYRDGVPDIMDKEETDGKPTAIPEFKWTSMDDIPYREYIVDSGASYHLVNEDELTPQELKTKRKIRNTFGNC